MKCALAFALCLGLAGLPGCFGSGFLFCGGAAPSQTEVSIYPTDAATGSPVRAVSFTEQGTAIDSSCGEPAASDATLCVSEVLLVDPGSHVITISAPGYTPQTVTFDAVADQSVHQAVQLTAAP
jgi:hypothetical protein